MHTKRISSALFFLLLAICAFYLAKVSWQLVDLFTPQPARNLSITDTKMPDTTDTPASALAGEISRHYLFGKPASKTRKAPAITGDIKNTQLNIQLLGLVGGTGGVAVISYEGKQGAYRAGDQIAKSTKRKLELAQIAPDHIIIFNNGVAEKLILPRRPAARQRITAKASTSFKQVEQVQKLDLNTEVFHDILGGKPRVQLASNPLALSRYMNLSPRKQGSRLRGYSISPGKDQRLMQQAGLKPRDLITHIDGVPAAELAIPSLFDTLKNAPSVTLTIERNGQPMNMEITL